MKAGDALFQSKGMVHIEESLIDVSRAIGVELKDGPVSTSNVPAEVPKAFPRDAATLLLDNGRVAVWDLRWRSGQPLPPHVHDRDTIVVPIETGNIGLTALKPVFTVRNQAHGDEAVAGSSRAVIVELK